MIKIIQRHSEKRIVMVEDCFPFQMTSFSSFCEDNIIPVFQLTISIDRMTERIFWIWWIHFSPFHENLIPQQQNHTVDDAENTFADSWYSNNYLFQIIIVIPIQLDFVAPEEFLVSYSIEHWNQVQNTLKLYCNELYCDWKLSC